VSRSYVSVEQAIAMPGVRIAFSRGVFGPWSEAVRAIYDIKRIDYVAVEQRPGEPNEALQRWTGQSSAPVAMLDDDRPRINWHEMLVLAEQLAPQPRLIPAVEEQRALMFGLCHALASDDGLGWAIRELLFERIAPSDEATRLRMRRKFQNGVGAAHSIDRVRSILAMLAARIDAQERRGSVYLIGDALSAADIYWTCFSNLVAAIPPEQCPMPEFYRELARSAVRELGFGAPAILIRHRDRILAEHFILPMQL
jgi:glutathione S-transferase